MPSLFNARSFLHCCMKQRTSGFEKAASRQRKIYIMKKSYHVTLTHVASLREFFGQRTAAVDLLDLS